MPSLRVSREDVIRHRFRTHGLDADPGSVTIAARLAMLDYGVQDSGADGSGWAIANRGGTPAVTRATSIAWTLRGAPHAYRRTDLDAVAVATAPLSEADAAKRIFDAAKPLKAAGIACLDALAQIAAEMREIVVTPVVKGEMSRRLTGRVGPAFLRFCRPCNTTHLHEMPFRLAALQAGLELERDTSPPVLRRIPGLEPPLYTRLGTSAGERFDVVRNYLRFYGPSRMKDAAVFIDAAAKDVKAGWPSDAVEVRVDGADDDTARHALPDDAAALASGGPARTTPCMRLLGSFDPYLQLRDRELLVADESRRKVLWPVLGRPGAVVADGEVLGTWRPRTAGGKLTLLVDAWTAMPSARRALVAAEAERLAAHRGVALAKVDYT